MDKLVIFLLWLLGISGAILIIIGMGGILSILFNLDLSMVTNFFSQYAGKIVATAIGFIIGYVGAAFIWRFIEEKLEKRKRNKYEKERTNE